MAAKYVPVTAEQFRSEMRTLGFGEVTVRGTFELVFEHSTKVPDLVIRIYSSINPDSWDGQDSGSRGVGKDAGRVSLIDLKSGKPVWNSKRCNRTAGFLRTIAERAREAWRAVRSLQRCPECQDYMVLRKSSKNKEEFYGCLKFPKCRGTRPKVASTPTSKASAKAESPKSDPIPESQDGGVI